MVVNDNACGLDKRGALESIASKLAPTAHRRQAGSYRYCVIGVSRNCVKNLFDRNKNGRLSSLTAAVLRYAIWISSALPRHVFPACDGEPPASRSLLPGH
ncbi:hypothetical protein CRX42_14510 [Pseudomonas jessenii]|uniref:Uncharacterized protein n=1 Tax=Pseudomonas jessenii TaxID=77298 RepID=A0A2W0EQ90_PSEJE|nr:hypothetical protein CRX42_14510 [Pseudomonas jessenii]